MAQVINQEPGFGYRFGTGLGGGLGQTLQALSQLKLQDLAQRQQATFSQGQQAQTSNLLQKFGLPQEASAYIATLPPKEQWAAVQELSGLGALGGLAPQQEQAPQAIGQIAPQETSRPLSQVLGLMGNRQAPQSVQELLSLGGLGQQQQPAIPQQQPVPQVAPQPNVPQNMQQAQPEAQQPPIKSPVAKAEQKPSSRENPRPVPEAEVRRPITPAEQIALKRQLREQAAVQKEVQKIEQATAKEKRQEQKDIDKETLPFYRDTLKSEESARRSNLRLSRMENLVKKGSLPNSTLYRLFKGLEETKIGHAGSAGLGAAGAILGGTPGAVLGGIVGALIEPLAHAAGGAGLAIQRNVTAPNTEEFEKLSTDFIREAKDIFGARITNLDLSTFLQIIPTLMQSDAGKIRIIENIRALNKAVELRANAMKQIIKSNGGKRPANLELLVDEYTKSSMDALADQFMSGFTSSNQQSPAANQPSALERLQQLSPYLL